MYVEIRILKQKSVKNQTTNPIALDTGLLSLYNGCIEYVQRSAEGRMYENIDVDIGYVFGAFTSFHDTPWRFEYDGRHLYKGEKPKYALLYVWEGGYCHHRPAGDCVTVPPGSLVLFRAGSAPYYNTQAKLPSRISNISFFTQKPLPMELEDNVRMIFKPETSWGVEDDMTRALALSAEKPFAWRMQLRSIVSHLLVCVMEQYFEGQKQSDEPALLTESIKLIRRHIFSSTLSVSEVARRCHVTPTYLIRLFSRHLGKTPKQYMDGIRVERACELLRYTDKSVEEIAAEAGFSEARQLRRVFHEIEGISPREYRKQV